MESEKSESDCVSGATNEWRDKYFRVLRYADSLEYQIGSLKYAMLYREHTNLREFNGRVTLETFLRELRAEARKRKDYELADRIRNALREAGLEVRDHD